MKYLSYEEYVFLAALLAYAGGKCDKVSTIKLVREVTGCTLKAAKDFVDAWEQEGISAVKEDFQRIRGR